MKAPKMKNLKVDKKGTRSIRKAAEKSKKVKITINFDADVLDQVKRLAADMGAPYQTLLNKIVKDSMAQKESQERRLDRLEKEIRALKKKVAS